MTLDEIKALTLDVEYFNILSRLNINFIDTPEGEESYTLDPDTELSMHKRITLNSVFKKPTLTAMKAELVKYKAELTVIENARLIEAARKADLRTRGDALDPNTHAQLHPEIPGRKAYFIDMIMNEEDHALAESRLKDLEDKDNELSIEAQSKAYIGERKAKYPPIAEQLDMIYHDIDAWKATIKAVKDSIPKP